MGELSASELRRALALLPRLYAPTTMDGFGSQVLSFFEQLLPADMLSYNEVEIGGRFRDEVTPSDALPADLVERFVANIDQHPLIGYFAQNRSDRAVQFSDFVNRHELLRLALYNEFFRPLGLDQQMAICVQPETSPMLVGVAVNRGSTRRFSEAERALLELVHPHLAQAQQNARVLSLLEAHGAGANVEVVLISDSCQVVSATEGARRWLVREGVASASDPSRLSGEVLSWAQGLQRYFRGATDATPPEMQVRRDTRESVATIRFVPAGYDGGMDCLVIADRRRPRFPDLHALMLAERTLSRREAEVALLAARGLTNAAIANELVISVLTVKKHVENIYEKLGVRSRAALATYLLGVRPD